MTFFLVHNSNFVFGLVYALKALLGIITPCTCSVAQLALLIILEIFALITQAFWYAVFFVD